MHKPSYEYKLRVGTYVFTSIGPRGEIEKGVIISRVNPDDEGVAFYNLAFGNLKIIDGTLTIADDVRSNNGDMPKILATVAKIAINFMKENKAAVLTFNGLMDEKSFSLGRNQRNLLYHRAINSNWLELSNFLKISGLIGLELEDYVPGKHYDLILVHHK